MKLKFWHTDETTNLPIGEPEVFDVRYTHLAAKATWLRSFE